MLYTSGLHAWQ